MLNEIIPRLEILASILQSQSGSPESRLERALSYTESLIQWVEARAVSEPSRTFDTDALRAEGAANG